MNIFISLLDILFPPKCVFCGRITDSKSGDEKYTCSQCKKTLPWTSSASGVTRGDFFAECISPLFYRDRVRDSVHRFKFGKQESYAKEYGRLIAEFLASYPEIKFDFISYTPLSRQRLRTRGFNQAQAIAKSVSACTGFPLKETLCKTVHTPAQSSLSDKSQRRANITGAFAIHKSADVSGAVILLIDDVVTTAATLSECSRVLLMAGAEKIYCATLAKAGTTK